MSSFDENLTKSNISLKQQNLSSSSKRKESVASIPHNNLNFSPNSEHTNKKVRLSSTIQPKELISLIECLSN